MLWPCRRREATHVAGSNVKDKKSPLSLGKVDHEADDGGLRCYKKWCLGTVLLSLW